MSGNALNGICETRRFEKDEYFKLQDNVLNKLRTVFPESLFQPIEAYKNKPTFGDMDLLVWNAQPTEWVRYFTLLFDTKGWVKNGSVYSFEYQGIQIDLIQCKSDDFFTSAFYFSFNDLGNLMGRIAHKMGFKYGHRGLTYDLRDGDQVFAEIAVSQDPKEIFEFLGYDFERYQDGFDELEDIFEFVISSRFFNKDIYLLHNRNHTSRTRDKKRKTYTEFLTWVADKECNYYAWPSMDERGGRKDNVVFMNDAFNRWPYFLNEIEKNKARLERQKLAKQHFNGDLVRKWTGREAEDLGQLMRCFRESITGIDKKLDFTTEVLKLTLEEVKQKVIRLHNHLEV